MDQSASFPQAAPNSYKQTSYPHDYDGLYHPAKPVPQIGPTLQTSKLRAFVFWSMSFNICLSAVLSTNLLRLCSWSAAPNTDVLACEKGSAGTVWFTAFFGLLFLMFINVYAAIFLMIENTNVAGSPRIGMFHMMSIMFSFLVMLAQLCGGSSKDGEAWAFCFKLISGALLSGLLLGPGLAGGVRAIKREATMAKDAWIELLSD